MLSQSLLQLSPNKRAEDWAIEIAGGELEKFEMGFGANRRKRSGLGHLGFKLRDAANSPVNAQHRTRRHPTHPVAP